MNWFLHLRYLLVLNELNGQGTFANATSWKGKANLQLVWQDQTFIWWRSDKNSPKDQTFYRRRAKQHKVCKLPPTTTSLYSVMAYEGQITRAFPFHTREICCFSEEMPSFCCNKVVAGDTTRAWLVRHRMLYISKLNLSANQHNWNILYCSIWPITCSISSESTWHCI